MTTLQITYILLLAVAAFGSGFFSGSETALIGIGKERVQQLAERSRRGQRVKQLASDPDRLLSTLLVANNLVNILGAAIATTLFIDLLGETAGPWVSTGVVTAVVLVVGEITPKSLAARYPERFSLAVAPAIWQMSRVLGPVARFFLAITNGLFRLFRVPPSSTVAAVTEADIRALTQLGLEGGEIHAVEQEIINALFTLADRPVWEVMTPRIDIVTLTAPVSLADVRNAVAATGHSRYPVTSGELDQLIGLLYVKDVFQRQDEVSPSIISGLLRTPHYLPESATILQVLQELRARRYSFAVILDEHGGVEGIVTIKDLVSELVGELQDEYDPGVPAVVRIGPQQWLTDGRMPIEDLAAAIGTELPSGPYTTAGGLFLAISGRVPGEGDTVSVDGVTLTVVEMDRNRVDRMRVEAPPQPGIIT